MPLNHLLILVPPSSLSETTSFYKALLAPLGYKEAANYMEGAVIGLGEPDAAHADFWIASEAVRETMGQQPVKGGYSHFAFTAKDNKLVEEAYAAGLRAGGKENGTPGPRPMYGEGYYAAFLTDPVGNNVEICCRTNV